MSIDQILLDFFGHREENYQKRQVLVEAQEAPTGVFLLKSGVVRQYSITENGDEVTLNIFKPLSFFPMNWVLNNTNSFFFEAMTDVTVGVAPKSEFLKFI